MFSQITVGTNNLALAMHFYGEILGTIGICLKAHKHNPERAIYVQTNSQTGVAFSVFSPLNGKPAVPGNGVTVAFEAENRNQVDEWHRKGMELGAADEGAPGLRQHYSPAYYGAYLRDPDGNKLCCACHQAH